MDENNNGLNNNTGIPPSIPASPSPTQPSFPQETNPLQPVQVNPSQYPLQAPLTQTLSQPAPPQQPAVTPPASQPPLVSQIPLSGFPKWILFLIIGIVLLLLVGGGILFVTKSKSNETGTTKTESGGVFGKKLVQTEAQRIAEELKLDSDSDYIPDIVETEVGLNAQSSELTRCQADDCGISDKSSAATVNTLIILDSSGSMAVDIGGGTKMEMAKQAIRSYIMSSPSNNNIGLMVYGHKGSNSQTDKPVSCASADIIGSIGSVSPTTIDGYLSQIKPVGWTPIGLAIDNALISFVGKEGQKNQIIIVTDGVETCNTDPVGKAAKALASAQKIQVNVIGFAVALSEQDSLSAISTGGGGTFVTAGSASELEDQFAANARNLDNFIADATCITQAEGKSLACYQDVEDKIQKYFYPRMNENAGNGDIYNLYSDTQRSILDKYSKAIDEMMNAAGSAVDERKDTLLDQ